MENLICMFLIWQIIAFEAMFFNAFCHNNTFTAMVGEPTGALYVCWRCAFWNWGVVGRSSSLFVTLHCLCLSNWGRPMGEATVASHVFLLANDKAAVTVLPINYAGRRGSDSTPGYVNLSLRRNRREGYLGREMLTSFFGGWWWCRLVVRVPWHGWAQM